MTVCSQGFGTCVFITQGWSVGTEQELMADYLVRAFEGALIAFLLYLGMGVNDEEYMKVCGWCHRCCYNHSALQTQKSLKLNSVDSYTLMPDDNASDGTSIALAQSKRNAVRFGHGH